MAFFEQLKDTAIAAAERTKVLAKTMSEKAEAAMEIQKLSYAIGKQEQIIKDNYQKLGEYIYQKYSEQSAIPEEAAEYCAAVTAALEEIEKLNQEIANIKMEQFGGPAPTSACPSCGESIAVTAKFCPQCGAPLEPKAEAKAEASEPAQASETPEAEAPAQPAEASEAPEAEAPAQPAEEAANDDTITDAEIVEEAPADAQAAAEEEKTAGEAQPPTENKA